MDSTANLNCRREALIGRFPEPRNGCLPIALDAFPRRIRHAE
jgi:hypothetical protein